MGWEQCDVIKAQKVNSIGKSQNDEVNETLENKITEEEGFDTSDSVSSFNIEDFLSSDDGSNIDNDNRVTNEDLNKGDTTYESNNDDLDLTKDEVDSVSPDVVVHIEDIDSTAGRFNTNDEEENYTNPDMIDSVRIEENVEDNPRSENESSNNNDIKESNDLVVKESVNIEEVITKVDESKVNNNEELDSATPVNINEDNTDVVESVSPDVVKHVEDIGEKSEKSDDYNALESVSTDYIDVKGLPLANEDDNDFKRGYYMTNFKNAMQDNPELDMDQEETIEFDA